MNDRLEMLVTSLNVEPIDKGYISRDVVIKATVDVYDIDEVIEQIDIDDFISHFGEQEILKHLSEDEIKMYLGIEDENNT